MENDEHITLLIETGDEALAEEAREELNPVEVSEASNFIGGISLAVFLLASIKTLQQTLKSVLDFLAKRSGRYEDASITIDGRKISLKGYAPNDVEKLLSLPIFDRFR